MTYRETTPRCPMCALDLAPKNISPEQGDPEEIDVCPGCGAVWLDWFDGDASALLAEHLNDAARPNGVPDMPRSERLLCPVCNTTLAEERWLESEATVLRCRECAGIMVRTESFGAIVTFVAHQPTEAVASGPWARFVTTIRSLVLGGPVGD